MGVAHDCITTRLKRHGSSLGRRGAIYFVRFRLPVGLAKALGQSHLQRSLFTAQLSVAKRRAAEARVWFDGICTELMSTTRPTRQSLEDAARRFFDALRLDVRPQRVAWEDWESFEAEQSELTHKRLAEIGDQLRQNQFDGVIAHRAAELVTHGDFQREIGPAIWTTVLALAARVERQRLLHDLHKILDPERAFRADDELFEGYGPPLEDHRATRLRPDPTERGLTVLQLPDSDGLRRERLADTVSEYLTKRSARGLSASSVTEAKRALDWLLEHFPDSPVRDIRKDQLRGFRDAIQRLDRRLQGRTATFAARQTNDRQYQLKLATQKKYWAAVKGFFAWCEAEGYVDSDPSAGLKLEPRKGEVVRTPAPFTDAEIDQFFSTPLYAGYASVRRPNQPGNLRVRNGYWWAGVLPLFTGMRAGELSQLLPSDFDFDSDIKVIRVRNEDDDGQRSKRTKTASSVRDIPISETLLTLGLREFVERRAKVYPKQRIFREFRLGANGRSSEGMSRFWGDYLKRYKLWKPGRATHVARHTVADRLRAAGVGDADIGALLGHANPSQTAAYGTYPLSRKAEIVSKLSYGEDFVERIGGAFATEHSI